jgi:hypothetical protein
VAAAAQSPSPRDLLSPEHAVAIETMAARRHPGATLDYLGPSPENGYRTASYEKDSNQEADDWTDLITLCFALDPDTTPDGSFEAAVSSVADEVEWAGWFAIHMLVVNQEGGIWRDTGDDYFLYFEPADSPNGVNAQFLPWDLDSVFGGFAGSFNQETIWRTTVTNPQRFLRSNAFAGSFVGAICGLLNTDFAQATMNARIDALPESVANAARKQALKDFVAARHVFVNNEIRRQLTLTGVPASPYTDPNPVIALSGMLNQCGTRTVTVNGTPAATFSVFSATWSTSYTLSVGNNTITVRDLDRGGAVIDTVEQSVFYAPPGSCTTDPQCDDGQFCNGAESCVAGACQAGTAVGCDDGVACTADACNEATDACDHGLCAMSVSASGSRYLSVTPPAGLPSVALRVSSAGLACLPKYVDTNGLLVAAPVFQSSAAWGTVFVSDREIVPSSTYTVQAEVVPGTPVGAGSVATWAWGDVDDANGVDVFDILCVLDGSQGIFLQCTPQGEDLAGNVTNRAVDAGDIAAVLDAFSGSAYPDGAPCGPLVSPGTPKHRSVSP